MNLQDYFNQMAKEWQNERANTQMTLGELIIKLESIDKKIEIEGIGEPHSYRGYYEDLAFEKTNSKITVGELLNIAKECLNQTFTGYKGGDFTMTKTTPIWISNYGCCGVKIIDIDNDGCWIIKNDDI